MYYSLSCCKMHTPCSILLTGIYLCIAIWFTKMHQILVFGICIFNWRSTPNRRSSRPNKNTTHVTKSNRTSQRSRYFMQSNRGNNWKTHDWRFKKQQAWYNKYSFVREIQTSTCWSKLRNYIRHYFQRLNSIDVVSPAFYGLFDIHFNTNSRCIRI